MRERRGYRVQGTVQGVGFRWWTRKAASANELRGTVRNAEDGSVEIIAEGEATALDDFEAQLQRGPSAARVRAVQREDPGDEPLSAAFEIIR